MQKLFDEVGSLDRRCYEKFALSEDILMEHAAQGMADFIMKHYTKKCKIVVICGSGNNGADGIALARLLHGEYDVAIFYVKEPKSEMAKLQQKRAQQVGVKTTIYLNDCDVLVDAVFGTGFNGKLDYEQKAVMQAVNDLNAYKIACDIPSGMRSDGKCDENTFVADVSLTMGALKKSLYSDMAKEYVGKITVLDLGVSRAVYEGETSWKLLDFKDMKLPHRTQKDCHKGSYGHLALACGEKSGASILSASAALRFGTGLVTLIGFKEIAVPYSIMCASALPENATALALGMGLGNEFSEVELGKILDNNLPLIADADIFYMPMLEAILQRKDVIITPHPKEFVTLLQQLRLAEITVATLQADRFHYVELFCKAYPNVVLLLKGANVIIAKYENYYVNPHGSAVLAKGGSGDVLSGLIGALLAQEYSPLEATISASLAHTQLAKNYTDSDFSLTPEDLIAGIGNL